MHGARPCFVCVFRYRIILRAEFQKSIALRSKFRFILRMIRADTAGSKLYACATRRAKLPEAISLAQLGKGRCFAPPRCIPSLVPKAAPETVPVSVPFGLSRIVVIRSWEKRP